MYGAGGASAPPLPLGAMGLSLEELRQAFREFDLDKNGCGAFVRAAARTFAAERRVVRFGMPGTWAPLRLRTC
jgi:hypothetical protein